ncbi:MAG: Ig-like domain-containing protein [Bacteroidota bacterium]
MKRSLVQISFFSALLVWVVSITSCANIIPPSGGPRDSLPPKLVASLPKDSAVNISPFTKNITLTFDEYITLQSPNQAVIFSPNPLPNRVPGYDFKLRNVTVKIKDTLEPNTTYSIDFGDAIRDVNESNIAKNLRYVFSTGKSIDYNTYKGKVIVAEKGKADSTLLVVLHRNLADTAITKENPRYYTHLNGKGEFAFKNLPTGTFAVYVISNNYLKHYDDSTQLFAFRNEPVVISAQTPFDTLYAFEAFKKPAKENTQAGIKPVSSIKEDKRLKYSVDLENGQQDLLSVFTINFNRKLGSFDSTKIILSDTNYNRLNAYSFSLDTGKTKLSIHYPWKESLAFRLQLQKDAVADSAGINLPKSDTIKFITKRESDYGSIRLRFTNLDLTRNPVLQFVQNDKILESVKLTQPDFQRKLYRQGSYELRILYDTNNNGVWDTGKFFGTKRQPEVVLLVPKQLAVRANWDNEVNISL